MKTMPNMTVSMMLKVFAMTTLISACKPPAAPTGALPPEQSEGNVRAVVASSAPPVVAPTTAPAPATTSTTASASTAAKSDKLYTVVDGTKVDANTLQGFRTWRAAACDRCHGANQEGMVGPSLIASLKVLSKDEFVKTLKDGRLEKGMPGWSTNTQVMDNIDNLYAYLKGRSDGAITVAHVSLIQ